MKIGTLSVNINTPDYNYGAMLHSYAFIKFLKKYPFVESAEIIDYLTPSVENKKLRIIVPDRYKRNKIRDLLTLLRMNISYRVRDKKFKRFINNYMEVSHNKYTQKTLKHSNLNYDCLICESDVIWSPLITGKVLDPAFFLAFDNMKDKRKIAYSPSLGDGIYDKKHEKDLKKYIKSLDFISCRETYACDIVKKLTNKNVTHVLDPVMLLDGNDFDDITASRIISEKYIFLYLPVNDNPKLRLFAKEYAEKYGYKILEISTKLFRKKSSFHKTIPDAGIEEFLSALKYSECVFTNSFHAVCYSVLYKKEFYAFSRKYGGKIENFCEILGLSNRYFGNDEFIEQKKIKYDSVYKKLEKFKRNSIEYIEHALKAKI